MEKEYTNEILADEKGISNKVSLHYFKYQNPSLSWFTNQSFKSLEIETKINITLVIN